jgi:hypothetical protein
MVGLGRTLGHALQIGGIIVGVGGFSRRANGFVTTNLHSQYRSTLPLHELETVFQLT